MHPLRISIQAFHDQSDKPTVEKATKTKWYSREYYTFCDQQLTRKTRVIFSHFLHYLLDKEQTQNFYKSLYWTCLKPHEIPKDSQITMRDLMIAYQANKNRFPKVDLSNKLNELYSAQYDTTIYFCEIQQEDFLKYKDTELNPFFLIDESIHPLKKISFTTYVKTDFSTKINEYKYFITMLNPFTFLISEFSYQYYYRSYKEAEVFKKFLFEHAYQQIAQIAESLTRDLLYMGVKVYFESITRLSSYEIDQLNLYETHEFAIGEKEGMYHMYQFKQKNAQQIDPDLSLSLLFNFEPNHPQTKKSARL